MRNSSVLRRRRAGRPGGRGGGWQLGSQWLHVAGKDALSWGGWWVWGGVQGRRPPSLELSPKRHPGSRPAPRSQGHCPATPREAPQPSLRADSTACRAQTGPGTGTHREEVRRGAQAGARPAPGSTLAGHGPLPPLGPLPTPGGPASLRTRGVHVQSQHFPPSKPGCTPPRGAPSRGMSAQPLTQEGPRAPRHRPCGSSRAGGGGGLSLAPPSSHFRIQAGFSGTACPQVPALRVPRWDS